MIKFRPIALVVLCCALAAPLPMAASVHRFVSAPPVRRSAPPVYFRANPAVRPQARPPMAFRPTPGPRPSTGKGTIAGGPRRVQLAQSVGRPQGVPAAPNQPQGYRMRSPGPHRGDWLRQYGSLPSDQMRRQLEQDKTFQSLPAERQQILRQRLDHFSSLPPDKRQKILNRMEMLEHMPPEQQQRVEGLFQQFRSLRPDRRQAVVQQLRQLRSLPPEQRNRVIDSGQFKSGFDPQERQLIRGLNEIQIPGPRRPGF